MGSSIARLFRHLAATSMQNSKGNQCWLEAYLTLRPEFLHIKCYHLPLSGFILSSSSSFSRRLQDCQQIFSSSPITTSFPKRPKSGLPKLIDTWVFPIDKTTMLYDSRWPPYVKMVNCCCAPLCYLATYYIHILL